MENLGKQLKQQRLEKGWTLQQVSTKTKLSVIQLEAIEEGNIEFFKDDLSYLSYFVRYYANALGVNYNDLRSELDDEINAFTNTMSLTQVEKQENITNNVQKRAKQNVNLTKAKKSHKFDVANIAFIVLAIAIFAVLGYAFINHIILGKNSDPIQKDVVVTQPENKKETDSTEEPKEGAETETKEPEKAAFTVTQTTLNANAKKKEVVYEISGWKKDEDVTFDFEFPNRSWISFTYDEKPLPGIEARIYDKDNPVKAIVKAEKDKVFVADYGYFKGNIMKVNGVDVVVDEAIANSDVAKVSFKFVEGAQ